MDGPVLSVNRALFKVNLDGGVVKLGGGAFRPSAHYAPSINKNI